MARAQRRVRSWPAVSVSTLRGHAARSAPLPVCTRAVPRRRLHLEDGADLGAASCHVRFLPRDPRGTGRVHLGARRHFVASQGCTYVQCITKQWLHLLPQHGAGVKHARPIVLEPWQVELIDSDPRPLIRGLIHSDGWRGTNWTTKTVGGTTKKYTYPRYQFSNRSADIHRIFTDALDRLGIAWRKANQWTISVARRDAVAALDEFVGPKT